MLRDHGHERAHYREAAEGFVGLVGGVADEDWSGDALGVWTVRDLVGHTTRALLTVESYLDPSRTTTSPGCEDAVAYFHTSITLVDPAAIAERGRQAGKDLGDQPAAAVAGIARRVLALVEASPDNCLVETPAGTMTLIGYLPTRTLELVVHGLDLAAATGQKPPAQFVRPLRACLRLGVDLAAARGQGVQVLLALTGRQALPDRFSVV